MNIRQYLKEHILLFDGSMGTWFAEKYREFQENCERANLTAPEKVLEIHREYIEAGCHAIKTNTFASNPLNYGGDEELLRSVLNAGMKLAHDAAKSPAAKGEVFVFADIGPILGAEEEVIWDAYRKTADIFLEAGAENFLFETNPNDDHLERIAEYIKGRKKDAFIIVSFAVQPDGYTREGIYAEDLMRRVRACEAIDAFGLNCVTSAAHLSDLVSKCDFSGKMLCVMPNAGYPRVVGNRMFFDSDPEYFAQKLAEIVAGGASIVGACCGTNPEFIRAAARMLKHDRKGNKDAVSKSVKYLSGEKGQTGPNARDVRAGVWSGTDSAIGADSADGTYDEPSAKTDNDNLFWKKMERGERVIAAELDPPRNDDGTKFMQGARILKSAGVDAMTLADCPTAHARMDSSLMACKVRREVGIDTIPHMTCRDRNLNATKALLLGLSMEGVRNVLAVTGDPVPTAERDEVKIVYQFNSRRLARYITSLNQTEFSQPIRVFGALNVNAHRFDVQLEIAKKKIENGICGFLTQPVLTKEALENLKYAYRELDAKILGGIIPVVSSRNGRFMNNEISGITVDEKIIDLYEGRTKEECAKLAVGISLKIAEEIAPYIDGYYLMTPFYRTDIMAELIAGIRKMEGR